MSACLAALALLAPASAGAAGPSAAEEYTLALPGVPKTDLNTPTSLIEETKPTRPIGVVGEQDDTFTRLGAVSSAILTPAGIAILALAAGGLALAARRRESRI